tara:strand:+ start:1334 stop:1582 length:249 start_codon:yes stop_codon:yes gene_type:complete
MDLVNASASSAPRTPGEGADIRAEACGPGARFVMNLAISCMLDASFERLLFSRQGVVIPSIASAATDEAWNQLFRRKPAMVG